LIRKVYLAALAIQSIYSNVNQNVFIKIVMPKTANLRTNFSEKNP